MNRVSLIVEGDEDVRFLEDFIEYHFHKKINKNSFIVIGGKSDKIHESKALIELSMDKPNIQVVIFDADDHDYDSTIENIKAAEEKNGLRFDHIFLFPNNERGSKGNLETLLTDSIPAVNKPLLNCIKNYSSCKVDLKIGRLNAIDEKQKLLIYHGSFDDSGEARATKRKVNG